MRAGDARGQQRPHAATSTTSMTGSHMLNRTRVTQVGLGTAIIIFCTAPVRAELGWSVDAGASHTDNATLADNGGASDSLTSIGGAVAYDLDGSRVKAALNGH